MTDIEKKALATAVEAAGRRMQDYNIMAEENVLRQSIEAHARAIEQHEAFKREVSDALEYFMDGPVGLGAARERLGRFILPKPVDPAVAIIRDGLAAASPFSGDTHDFTEEAEVAVAALSARGGRIVFDGEGE